MLISCGLIIQIKDNSHKLRASKVSFQLALSTTMTTTTIIDHYFRLNDDQKWQQLHSVSEESYWLVMHD